MTVASPGPARQAGAALLIALVVVAIASVLATLALERSQRDALRSQSIEQGERSYQYARGMEVMAWEMIRQAREEGMDDAALDGQWTEPLEVPGGLVRARLLDQSGRFNLNALGHPESGPRLDALHQFQRLLAALALPPELAEEVAEWVDTSREGAIGPGNSWYAGQDPPYRVAGTLMANTSELRWLRSMDAEALETLAPHVSALPVADMRVNVNTTTPEVLASFSEALEVEQAARVLEDAPFDSLETFLEHPGMGGIETAGMIARLTSQSEWYLAHARVELEGIPRDYYRLLGQAPGEIPFRYFSIGTP